MDNDVKKLKEKFIKNGGTEQEFETKRNAAMERADILREKIAQDKEKDIKDLTDKGYTRSEAVATVKSEVIEAAEARGFGKRSGR